MNQLFETLKPVQAFAPSADVHTADPVSDAVNTALYGELHALLHIVATTGTAVVTVEACSAADGTGNEAIAFEKADLNPAGSPADALGAFAAVAATGFTTDTSATRLYVLRIPYENLPDGKPFVRLQLTEGVDAATIGSGIFLASKPRFSGLPSAVS